MRSEPLFQAQILEPYLDWCIHALVARQSSKGEILEINQVAGYFNYVNRTVTGLGVNTKGDILGLSPSESNDPKNWSHQ